MSQANELEDRLIDFAVRIIHLTDALPDSPAAKYIVRQLCDSDFEGIERDKRFNENDLPCEFGEDRIDGRTHRRKPTDLPDIELISKNNQRKTKAGK